jgi:hypothetical protein
LHGFDGQRRDERDADGDCAEFELNGEIHRLRDDLGPEAGQTAGARDER